MRILKPFLDFKKVENERSSVWFGDAAFKPTINSVNSTTWNSFLPLPDDLEVRPIKNYSIRRKIVRIFSLKISKNMKRNFGRETTKVVSQ